MSVLNILSCCEACENRQTSKAALRCVRSVCKQKYYNRSKYVILCRGQENFNPDDFGRSKISKYEMLGNLGLSWANRHTKQFQCLECPKCVDCKRSGVQPTVARSWSAPYSSKGTQLADARAIQTSKNGILPSLNVVILYDCNVTGGHCEGGMSVSEAIDGKQKCADGSDGPLCSICNPSHHRGGGSGGCHRAGDDTKRCRQCDPTSTTKIVIFAVLLLLAIVLALPVSRRLRSPFWRPVLRTCRILLVSMRGSYSNIRILLSSGQIVVQLQSQLCADYGNKFSRLLA